MAVVVGGLLEVRAVGRSRVETIRSGDRIAALYFGEMPFEVFIVPTRTVYATMDDLEVTAAVDGTVVDVQATFELVIHYRAIAEVR